MFGRFYGFFNHCNVSSTMQAWKLLRTDWLQNEQEDLSGMYERLFLKIVAGQLSQPFGMYVTPSL